jgi:hypothetical protein
MENSALSPIYGINTVVRTVFSVFTPDFYYGTLFRYCIVIRRRAGRSGFGSRRGWGIFLFTAESGPALGPPSNAEVRNAWSYTSTLPYVFMV